jgi:hypothetical protein
MLQKFDSSIQVYDIIGICSDYNGFWGTNNILNLSDYNGFWGAHLNPPIEAEINRLCNQFS